MSAGTKMKNYTHSGQFEYLIIDEGCQATELASLIPYRLHPEKVIIVGDQ